MKYRYDQKLSMGTRRKRRKTLLTGSTMMLLSGAYVIALLISPNMQPIAQSSDPEGHNLINYEALAVEKVAIGDNQLIIPKIGVNVAFLAGKAKVMETGAWHRFPERGDPEKGGNFIVSAHRFNLGLTPQQTKARSPFYHINKLDPGDVIYADYMGSRYTYEVNKRYSVKPNAIEIENESTVAKLTLYSCTLKGAKDGREVIEAALTAKNGVAIAPSGEEIALR